MKYMIMECHKGYAVALDEEGRFLRVANMHYEIGQVVPEVTAYMEEQQVNIRKKVLALASLAACFCCLIIGSLNLFVISYGTVRLQINPEVNMSVNRLCYVTRLEGVNEDGVALVEGYSYRGKKVEQVLNELTEKAIDEGYLTEGGVVNIEVNSKHTHWKEKNLDGLAKKMEEHFKDTIRITHTLDGGAEQERDTFESDNKESNTPNRPNMDESDDEDDNESDDDKDDRDDDSDDEKDESDDGSDDEKDESDDESDDEFDDDDSEEDEEDAEDEEEDDD